MSTTQTESSVLPQPLKLWEKIVVVVGEGADAGRYASRIEDFAGDYLVITEPQFLSGNTLLRDGLHVSVQLTRDDAIYQFESRICRGPVATNGQALLSTPHRFCRVQRRLFVRIGLRERVEFAVVTPDIDWSCWEHSLPWGETQSIDISGGGMRIAATEEVRMGSLLLLRLRSFKREMLPEYVFAVCRRIMNDDEGKSLGLEFVLAERLDRVPGAPPKVMLSSELTLFNNAAQNKLVVWIFNKQIALRQKGLL